jgi:hypothetical protein
MSIFILCEVLFPYSYSNHCMAVEFDKNLLSFLLAIFNSIPILLLKEMRKTIRKYRNSHFSFEGSKRKKE